MRAEFRVFRDRIRDSPLKVVMPNIGAGIPIGVGAGIAIGTALDAKAKKEGRVICPGERTAVSAQKTKIIILIGLGVLVAAGLVRSCCQGVLLDFS